jgi:hypothetical protein
VDDSAIISVFDNRNLHQLVQVFLREFPGLLPSQIEVEEWEGIYVPNKIVCFPFSDSSILFTNNVFKVNINANGQVRGTGQANANDRDRIIDDVED